MTAAHVRVEVALKFIEIVLGIAFPAAAVYIFIQAQKKSGAAAAKDDLVKSLSTDRDSWKSLHELQEIKFDTYRTEVHAKNDETNARIIALTTENVELKSKTDLTPLMTMMKTFISEQTEINKEILSALTTLVNPPPKKRRKAARSR